MTATVPVISRPATPGDSDALQDLLGSQGPGPAPDPSAFLVAEAYAEQLPGVRLPVAEAGPCCIVGCARLDRLPEGGFELANLAVHPDCREQPIGVALVRDALARVGGEAQALSMASGPADRLGVEPTDAILERDTETRCEPDGAATMTGERGG